VLYGFGKWGCPCLAAWFPRYKSQLETTAQVLEGAAVFYGFAAAGDAKAGNTIQLVSSGLLSPPVAPIHPPPGSLAGTITPK